MRSLSRDGQIDYDILRHHLERVDLARRDLPSVRGRSPNLWRLLDGKHLPVTDPIFTPQGDQPQECPVADGQDSPRWSKSPGRRSQTPPRVKVETAIRQTEGAIGFYEGDLFKLAGDRTGRGKLARRPSPIVAALKRYLRFLETRSCLARR